MQPLNRALLILSCAALAPFTTASLLATAHAEQSLYAPAGCHEVARAGNPACQAPWAIPTDPYRYAGYYVGGGAVPYGCFSGPLRSCSSERYRDQGTWGWDYVGYYVPPFVRLRWWHPRHYQGGAGNYAPDGPHYCEDLKKR
jgi:hypothetical protein